MQPSPSLLSRFHQELMETKAQRRFGVRVLTYHLPSLFTCGEFFALDIFKLLGCKDSHRYLLHQKVLWTACLFSCLGFCKLFWFVAVVTSLRKGNRNLSLACNACSLEAFGVIWFWALRGLSAVCFLSALGPLHHHAQNATVSFPGTALKYCELIQQGEPWLSSGVEQGFDRNSVSRLITGNCHPTWGCRVAERPCANTWMLLLVSWPDV